MADQTRKQSLGEQVKRLAVGVELLMQHRDDVNLKLDAIVTDLAKLSAAQIQNNDPDPSSDTTITSQGSIQKSNQENQPKESHHGYDAGIQSVRIDFPTFYGVDPKAWVRKCETFFKIYGIQEEHKVGIAELHLKDKADVWFESLRISYKCITWNQLKSVVCTRFEARSLEDAYNNFWRLKQSGSVEDYVMKFEELMPLVSQLNPIFLESCFVDCFIRGLRDDIKAVVSVTKPASMIEALKLARSHEAVIKSKMYNGNVRF